MKPPRNATRSTLPRAWHLAGAVGQGRLRRYSRSASAARLTGVKRRAFDELLNTAPGFAKKLLAGLGRRLRAEDAKTAQ